MRSFLASLQVPYNTLEIEPLSFGVYLDVKTGRIDLAKSRDLAGLYETITSVEALEGLSHLLFDFNARDYPDGYVY